MVSLWVAEITKQLRKKFYGKVPRLTISPNIKHLSYKSAAVKGNNLDTLGFRELPKGLGGRSYLSMSKFL